MPCYAECRIREQTDLRRRLFRYPKTVQTKWKVLIGAGALALVAGGVFGGIKYSQRDIVTVQTGKVIQEDLASIVTASGEINPRTYISIGAEYQGQVTDIMVRE